MGDTIRQFCLFLGILLYIHVVSVVMGVGLYAAFIMVHETQTYYSRER